jgi:hypothetical protein
LPVSRESNYLEVNFVTASRLGDSVMRYLQPIAKQVVWLRLSDTRITNAAMTVIATCVNLTRLQLEGTQVTDKGLAALKGLDQLRSLNLVNTSVTTAGLLSLKNLSGLQHVYVFKTGSSGKEWMALKKFFPKTDVDTGGYIVPLLPADTTLVKAPAAIGAQ